MFVWFVLAVHIGLVTLVGCFYPRLFHAGQCCLEGLVFGWFVDGGMKVG
jgi:hypothetical protein